jgi:hypothetical protein
MRKDEDKAWFAEAILEESGSQYLIRYEPIEEGAQCEISWQPKCNANEALIAWWEERKIGTALEDGNAKRDNVRDLLSEDNEASQHYTPVDLHSNDCDAMVGSIKVQGPVPSLETVKECYVHVQIQVSTQFYHRKSLLVPIAGMMESLLLLGRKGTKLRQRTRLMLESYAMVTRMCQGLLWEG